MRVPDLIYKISNYIKVSLAMMYPSSVILRDFIILVKTFLTLPVDWVQTG